MKWKALCKVNDIPELGARRLIGFDKKEIALFRCADGEIHALENRCPHKGGPLADGLVTGSLVICGLHAKKINLRTGCIGSSTQNGAQTFPTRVEEGTVFIGAPD